MTDSDPTSPDHESQVEHDSQTRSGRDEQSPSASRVYKYMLYGLSIPERALRSTTAAVGGVVQESSALLIPQAFRQSKSYTAFVQRMLTFLTRDVGRVQGRSSEEEVMEDFVARKAVGNFVEMASMATLHLSPVLVLAVISDVAHGSSTYLQELAVELKKQGIIAQESTIDSTSDLLAAVEDAAGTTALAFDTPPLSVDGLQQTIQQTRERIRQVDPTRAMPRQEIDRVWQEMHAAARKERVGLLQISTAMTLVALNRIGSLGRGVLSSVYVAGNMFDRHLLDHYSKALADVQQKGYYATLAETSQPYIEALWRNFSMKESTVTEDLLNGKLAGKAWHWMKSWL